MNTDRDGRVSDTEAYRIVEEMGLGLTFRSCGCGQLPCARLRPLRDALTTARKEARAAAFKSAAGIATAMASGEAYETGRQKALNIAAAIEAAANTEEGGGDG